MTSDTLIELAKLQGLSPSLLPNGNRRLATTTSDSITLTLSKSDRQETWHKLSAPVSMRILLTFFLSALFGIPAALGSEYSPFYSPNVDGLSYINEIINVNLFRRDDKCTSCSNLGNGNVCCGSKARCALDQSGNVACCPNNSKCTGTIPASGPAATSMPVGSSASAAPAASMTHAITGSSTVPNSFYPFPYLATAYPNADVCTSSYSSCQLEVAKCTGMLEGGGYGVTIEGAGGGTTQGAPMPVSSAESICSSLSSQACNGLQLSACSTLTGASATTQGTFVAGSANAAATKGAALYGVGFGMAIGLAGQVVG